MKKWLRLLIFLMAFQMEIRVRASANLLEQPSECLNTKEICSIKVKEQAFHFKRDALLLHATPEAVIVRQAENLWRFVGGSLWLEKSSGIKVETIYGTIEAARGQYWIIEQPDSILIRNMNADLAITLRDGKQMTLPDGFEFWISGMNAAGESEIGMVRPVDIKKHLPLWNSLYTGTKAEFVSEVKHIKENWGDLTRKSSRLYEEVVLRKLASVREKEESQKLQKQRLEHQRQQMKKLYHQRVFER